jgi:hypothetical protein
MIGSGVLSRPLLKKAIERDGGSYYHFLRNRPVSVRPNGEAGLGTDVLIDRRPS